MPDLNQVARDEFRTSLEQLIKDYNKKNKCTMDKNHLLSVVSTVVFNVDEEIQKEKNSKTAIKNLLSNSEENGLRAALHAEAERVNAIIKEFLKKNPKSYIDVAEINYNLQYAYDLIGNGNDYELMTMLSKLKEVKPPKEA